MELVDRYLKAVGTYLPADQRDDILRELSEDIRSQIEERESELARPLTEAEQEAILKQRGNPIRLAARYRQEDCTVAFGRQLIGTALFPFYIKVLSLIWGSPSLWWRSFSPRWSSAGRKSPLLTSSRLARCNCV